MISIAKFLSWSNCSGTTKDVFRHTYLMYCPSTTTSFDVVVVIKKVGGFISKSASEVQTTARYRKRYAERYENMLDMQKN